MKWLEPSFLGTMERLGHEGVREMLVVPISFVTEHIETLHEINIDGRSDARKWGIERFRMMPAVGDSAPFIAALQDEVLRALNIPAESRLSPEVRTRLNEPRFSERDGMHLRDCVLFKQVNTYAVGRATTDLQRVANLFQHVVRSIGLVKEHSENLPLAPYETYLLGEGTASDRAWIFAGLLRQLKIDAVLLTTSAAGKAIPKDGTFLVGVLLDGEVFLFDPHLGLPVPVLGGKGTVATLSQAVADPSVLKQFDLDAEHPYDLTAEQLKSPGVFLIGDTCFWSARMRQLQKVFTGKQSLIVSDFLEDVPGVPGAESRVTAGAKSHWDAAALSLWAYPEEQLQARTQFTEEQQKNWDLLTASWKAPVQIVNFDPMTRKPEFSRPQGDQFKMRLAHVQGDFEEAILGFTNMRLTSVTYILSPPLDIPIPEALQVMHRRAVDDATLWTGVCQFEQANYRMAADTFQKFLKTRTTGARATSARYHLALCQNALKDRAAAVKTLSGTPPDDPQYAGHQLLIRQWNAAP